MDANPILVEQTRGTYVENRHRGAFVVADAKGRIIASAGDVDRPVYPRSAIKSMQALAMLTSGSLERFALSDEQLALACASHRGEDVHVAGVTGFLSTIGLGPGDLECGPQQPGDRRAREALRAAGGKASPLHHYCSGKHSGMLSVARAMGVETRGYVERDHPVQLQVRSVIETVLGTALSTDMCGRDGCSIPTWAAPLSAFASGFARMATGEGLPAELATGARRLVHAATSHPHLVSGTDMIDTELMVVFRGNLMQKSGADGVQCGVIRDKGWGYALKCDDGNMDASEVMLAELLLRHAEPDAEQREVIGRYARKTLRNARGFEIGEMRATAALRG